jgi:hypothetical protein
MTVRSEFIMWVWNYRLKQVAFAEMEKFNNKNIVILP